MVEDKNLNFSQKVTIFVKNNMTNIVLILISLAYIFYGMLSVERTGKTIDEIIGGGALSALTGFFIKVLRGNSGITDGMISPVFIAKTNAYGEKKVEISPYIDELPQFCNYKNEARLKQKQSEFLAKYAMKYELFVNGYYDNDPTKQEILEKARKIKIYQYTPVTFTNAYDNAVEEEELLSVNVDKYKKKNNRLKIVLTIICGLLFGYYTVGKDFDWANVAWAAFQVSLYLIMGQIDYNNSYYFVTQTLRGKIERVISILDEFVNLRNEHPGIFALKFEEEKITQTSVNIYNQVEKITEANVKKTNEEVREIDNE